MNKIIPKLVGLSRRKYVFSVIMLLLFTLLAIWSTWPLAKSPMQKFALGTSHMTTVELFNIWTIWWNADRAQHFFSQYWDAPIFYPQEDTFAFSEPQPMTLLVAPVIWITGSRILAYNVYLLISLILNGFMANRLLRAMSIGRYFSFVGGATMILLPIVHWQRDVLQLIPIWGILWVWIVVLKLFQTQRMTTGFELGLAFSAVVYISVHHALCLAVLLPCSLWVSYHRWNQIQFWKVCTTGLLTSLLLAGPIIFHMRQVIQRNEFARPSEKVIELSAFPSDYAKPSGQALFDVELVKTRHGWRLGAGWFRTFAAALGILLGLRRSRQQRHTLFLFTLLISGFLFSLGPHLQVGSWQPWNTLYSVFPGIAQVRSPFRFSYFVQMSILLLAVQGIYDLWLLNISRRGRQCWKHFSHAIFILSGMLLIFETYPQPVVLAQPPELSRHQEWIDWLCEHNANDEGVICFPMAPGNLTQDFESTVEWMYFGTFHGMPLFNGYSGFFPEDYLRQRDYVRSEFPSADTLDELRRLHIHYVVIDHLDSASPTRSELEAFADQCAPVFQSESIVIIYRLDSPNPEARNGKL